MKKTSKLLKQFMDKYFGLDNYQNFAHMVLLKEYWEEITGDILATHSQVSKVDGSKLFVVVDHSIFHNELILQKKQILNKIKNITGIITVSEMNISIGPLEHSSIKNDRLGEWSKLEKKYLKYYNEVTGKKAPEKNKQQNRDITKQLKELDPDFKKLYELFFKSEK
jgi:hypothetical protein